MWVFAVPPDNRAQFFSNFLNKMPSLKTQPYTPELEGYAPLMGAVINCCMIQARASVCVCVFPVFGFGFLAAGFFVVGFAGILCSGHRASLTRDREITCLRAVAALPSSRHDPTE